MVRKRVTVVSLLRAVDWRNRKQAGDEAKGGGREEGVGMQDWIVEDTEAGAMVWVEMAIYIGRSDAEPLTPRLQTGSSGHGRTGKSQYGLADVGHRPGS